MKPRAIIKIIDQDSEMTELRRELNAMRILVRHLQKERDELVVEVLKLNRKIRKQN